MHPGGTTGTSSGADRDDAVSGRFRIVGVTSARPAVPESPVSESTPDHDSAAWVRGLGASGPAYDETVARLHGLLLRVARAELRRRRAQLPLAGPELDDLAHQAAADAVVAVVRKVGEFRGESRFTTWACKFAIFEVSTKVGRHFWQRPTVAMDGEDWDRLPDRFGLDPAGAAEWRDVVAALRRAVDESSPITSGGSLWPSCSTASRWTRWWPSSAPTATPSTKRSSTPDVSCGPRWSLTGIWTTTFRGSHE